jgi:spermidine synthase
MTASSGARRQWMQLPARIVSEPGTLCLPEGPGVNIDAILDQLRNGTYTRPFVIDDGRFRRLHFGLDFVQSEMSIADPDALNFAYTRMMMAFLLFAPRPRHVVLVGLGGGSLTRYCYRHLPRARITTIEIDGDVIDLSEWFELPADDERLQLIHADAADYFATTREQPDVVLVDACDGKGVAPAMRDPLFYRNLHARIGDDGVLVMNLIGKARDVQLHLEYMAAVFDGGVITHNLRRDGNRLAFAFKNPNYKPDWTGLQRRSSAMQQQYDLDFPEFVRKLRRSRIVEASDEI